MVDMETVELLYHYIRLSLSWLPTSCYFLLTVLIFIRFGDSLLGIINRAWKLLGRG